MDAPHGGEGSFLARIIERTLASLEAREGVDRVALEKLRELAKAGALGDRAAVLGAVTKLEGADDAHSGA